jgi:uncharacterized membrane protein YozB (DUF420 family)
MSTTARPVSSGATVYAPSAPSARRSYTHAHWYFFAAFLVVVAGFWPTFFRPAGAGTPLKNIHGVTSSLWYFGLMTQSWLMSRGLVRWHRRTAYAMVLLLPILSITALANTHVMLVGATLIPAAARPIIAFADFQSVAMLAVLTTLGILNRRTPPAHKRYMAATALVGFPPALARLYDRLGIDAFGPIETTFGTVAVILIVLIAVDWRMGERDRRAYPLLLGWTIALQLAIGPVSTTSGWLAFCRWFGALG